MRTAALLVLLLPLWSVAQGTTAPKVVKSAPQEMKAQPLPSAAPILDRPGEERMAWEYTGDFDVPPAHPACKDLAGDPRKACTAQEVLAVIKARLQASPPASQPPASVDVKVDFDVNQYGDVKQIRMDYGGDKTLADQIILALYALPRFVPATKAGARAVGHCSFTYAPALLFEKEATK